MNSSSATPHAFDVWLENSGEHPDRLERLSMRKAWDAALLSAAAKPFDPVEVTRRIVVDVAEIPDRTSPEDQPEMMLVKDSELRRIVHDRLMEALKDDRDERLSTVADIHRETLAEAREELALADQVDAALGDETILSLFRKHRAVIVRALRGESVSARRGEAVTDEMVEKALEAANGAMVDTRRHWTAGDKDAVRAMLEAVIR